MLHSFSLMEIGVHTDCIPGKVVSHEVYVIDGCASFITCQELCGTSHSGIVVDI